MISIRRNYITSPRFLFYSIIHPSFLYFSFLPNFPFLPLGTHSHYVYKYPPCEPSQSFTPSLNTLFLSTHFITIHHFSLHLSINTHFSLQNRDHHGQPLPNLRPPPSSSLSPLPDGRRSATRGRRTRPHAPPNRGLPLLRFPVDLLTSQPRRRLSSHPTAKLRPPTASSLSPLPDRRQSSSCLPSTRPHAPRKPSPAPAQFCATAACCRRSAALRPPLTPTTTTTRHPRPLASFPS